MTALIEETVSDRIDNEVTHKVLYNSLQQLRLYSTVSFVLPHIYASSVASLGDFHRLVYRSNVSDTLSSLYLENFNLDSRTSKLFAKCCCFCKVKNSTLSAVWKNNPTASAFLYGKFFIARLIRDGLNSITFKASNWAICLGKKNFKRKPAKRYDCGNHNCRKPSEPETSYGRSH